MHKEKIEKYENKERLDELNPMGTLEKVGFKDNMVLCDIGAGTGIFAIPAAKFSNKEVFALEKSDDMLEILEKRIKEGNIKNLKAKKVESEILPIEDNTCDLVTIIATFHHIDDKNTMIDEIKRISKEKARLLIIEFHGESNYIDAPKMENRVLEEELREISSTNCIDIIDQIKLGDNFYAMWFEL